MVHNGNNGGRDVQWSNDEVQNGKNGGRTIKGNIKMVHIGNNGGRSIQWNNQVVTEMAEVYKIAKNI